ncbi:MAG: mechanosensitive ion channel family protein [Alphaproteobacteria bacterium]
MLDIINNLRPYVSDAIWQWTTPFFIALGFILLSPLLANLLGKMMQKLLVRFGDNKIGDTNIDKNKNKTTDKVRDKINDKWVLPALSPDFFVALKRFIVVIGLFLALKTAPADFYGIADRIAKSAMLFFAFQVVYFSVQPVGVRLLRRNRLISDLMRNLILKFLRAAVIFIGAVSILEILGVEVVSIIAGIGLLGVAVALGAQDLFKNLIGGLLILAEKSFDEGDWIRADGVVEGVVEDIGFRSTLVRGFDKAPVHVPNNDLASTVVTNFSRLPHWRIQMMLGVMYNTDTEKLRQACRLIEKMLLNHDDIIGPDKAMLIVRVEKFSDSSIDIFVNCFAKTDDWLLSLDIKENLVLEIKKIMESLGIGFAFPSRSIYIEHTPSTDPALSAGVLAKSKSSVKS